MDKASKAAPAPGGAPFGAWERVVAVRYLRGIRKDGGLAVISVIAFLGVMLAVTAVISVMSIMNGFRSELLSRILGFNGHIYVGGQPLVSPDRDRIIRSLKQIPGVVRVAPMVDAQAMVIGANGNVSGAIVRGMTLADLQRLSIVSQNVKRGSLQGYGQGEYGGDLVLIGDRLADVMGVGPGDPITLISPNGDTTAFGAAPRRKTYTVAGTFSIGMSEYDQAYLYMPLEQAQLFFGRDTAVDAIELTTTNPDRIDDLKLAVARAAGPGAVLSDWRDRNASFFNALEVERAAMRLVVLIMVFVASLLILSGLIMLVKTKGRDIAILRTIGASRAAVMRIFFMAGAMIGMTGTLTGILLGVLFCTFIEQIQTFLQWITGADLFNADVYFLSHVPAKLDPGEVLIVASAALLMSFLATLWPAWRASRLDPVEALRYE
jgi:lipoprotein-releasing system permease protein